MTSKEPLCGFFASAFIFEQSRPDDSAAAVIHSFSLQEQCKHYERDLYERKTGAAAVGIHGAAQCYFHAGEQSVQHCRQPVRGPHQRRRHDCVVAGVPDPEFCQRHCHWHWHQCHDRTVPWRRRPQKGRDCRHPRYGAEPDARHSYHHCQHCHHAGLFAPVHQRRRPDCIRHHLLHHRIPVCHHQHGGTGL